jgi:hypothetical protein
MFSAILLDKHMKNMFYPELNFKAYSNLLENFGWKSLVILYENEDSLVKLQEVLKLPRLVPKLNYFSALLTVPVRLAEFDALNGIIF